MLYNGKDEYPDHEVLKLSDMFKDLEDSSFANLELKVNVYNINKGRNEEIATVVPQKTDSSLGLRKR